MSTCSRGEMSSELTKYSGSFSPGFVEPGSARGLTSARYASSSNEKTSTFSFDFLPWRMTLRK